MTDTHKILLHPGYPKTGSTSLQANVFAQHSDLNYLSCHSAPGHPFRDDSKTAEFYHLLRHAESDQASKISALWTEHFQPALQRDRLNIISDETFLNNEGEWRDVSELLRNTLGIAQVLLVIRDQAEILRSLYDMYPWRKGDAQRRFLNFPDWLETVLAHPDETIAGTLKFDETIQRYADLFGVENVIVTTVDGVLKDPARQRVICQRLNIDPDEFVRLSSRNPANTQADHASKKLVRRVLGPVRGSSFLTSGQIKLIRSILSKFVSDRPTALQTSDLKRIAEYYRGHRPDDIARLHSDGMFV